MVQSVSDQPSETTRDAVGGVAAGAVQGATVGGAAGAVVGAAKGALGSRRGRRVLAASIAFPVAALLVVALVFTQMLSAVLGGVGTSANQASAGVVTAAGVDGVHLSAFERAAADHGLPWQVLAAVYVTQRATAPVTDIYDLNDTAELPAADRDDLAAATGWVAATLSSALGATPGWDPDVDIVGGASVRKSGQVEWPDPTQKTRAVSAYLAALSSMPFNGASESWASRVMDTAIAWRLGVPANILGGANLVCAPSGDAADFTATTTEGTTVTVTTRMLTHAALIVNVGRDLSVSDKGLTVSLMVALQESMLQTYANVNVPESLNYPHEAVGSDNDSVNIFQQRPAWGPDVASLMDEEFAARAFFGRPPDFSPHPPGLLDIAGGESLDLGVWAQRVQVSAYPTAYSKWEPVAAAILGKVDGVTCTSGAGSVGSWAAVIEALKARLGTPYSWGGGNQNGPTAGFGSGAGVVGWDCSSFMMYGIYQGTGGKVLIPRTTVSQVAAYADLYWHDNAGVDQLQVGDLIYWGARSATTHVALYIGGGQIIEEPHTGDVAKITNLYDGWSGYLRLPMDQWFPVTTGPTDVAAGKYLSQASTGPITSDFGMRFHPVLHVWKLHDGMDYGIACGTPVYATAPGTVVGAAMLQGWGNQVKIDHGVVSGVNLVTTYNHLSGFVVRSGAVGRGQLIAYSGTTGYSTGCHLHFSVYVNGVAVDPKTWM